MTKEQIDLYITTNAKYFEPTAIPIVRQKLEKLPAESVAIVQSIEYKDPTVLLILSLLVGGFGVDRFMLGDTGMGVLKLLTCGCCGILTIIDWFTIMQKAKQYNLAKLSQIA